MRQMILSLLLVANLFALSENEIEPYMSKNINLVVKIIKTSKENNISNDITSKKIFKIFDPVFDYKLMSMLSLGIKVWRNLSVEQRVKFTKKFTRRLKDSYKRKLDMYKGQKIYVEGIKKIRDNRIHLLSNIKGKKQKFDIVYKFYKAKNAQWYIYDVNVVGVSIIQTYRSQFSDELKKISFQELLKKLDKDS